MIRKLALAAIGTLSLLVPVVANADTIKITVENRPDAGYYWDLLTESLSAAGHTVTLDKADASLPLARQISMFDSGDIDLFWFLQTPERDHTYVPVAVNLTKGLIGQRVMFIKKGAAPDFAKIKSLDDFRTSGKIGAFGKGWFDAAVWDANGLKYNTQTNFTLFYAMVAAGDRGVDYFSRGVTEILPEAKSHPELDIEPTLLLVYDRDFRFYLSKKAAAQAPVIEAAVKKAAESGIMDQLIQKYFGDAIQTLNLAGRTRINLVAP